MAYLNLCEQSFSEEDAVQWGYINGYILFCFNYNTAWRNAFE